MVERDSLEQSCPSNMGDRKVSWPHAPTHKLSQNGTYFVTAATYLKQHFFRQTPRLEVLQRGLLSLAMKYGWQMEAWSIFSNHYHFVAHSPVGGDPGSLSKMLGKLHEDTAKWINRLDGASGRQVWYNFWDTLLTYEASYLARLNYVHTNPVRHGLVRVANQYPWCSAPWFEYTARPAQIKTIYRMKSDRLHIDDDYEVDKDW